MPISFKQNDGRLFLFYTRNKKTYERNDWIQFYRGWKGVCFKIGIGGYFDRRVQLDFSFGWGQFFIDLPIYTKYNECDPPRYGFYYYESAIWLCLGRKTKKISMPYEYTWVRTSNLKKDGEWEHETPGQSKNFYEDKWDGILWKETYPYTYVLKSGEVQHRRATLRVEEREWRQKWLKWAHLFSKKRKSINVDFDGEVGERTGSWKGGCTGCGYTMNYGELPEQTLRRMEKDRKF
jgi:hypothetical protein